MTGFGPQTRPRVTEHHHYPLPPPVPGRYEPVYDGLGRYKLPDPETGRTKSWTRVTTVAKILDDTFHLDKWKHRNTVTGLMVPEIYADARRAVGIGVDRDVDTVVERAHIAAGAALSREFGDALHAWLDAVDMTLVRPRDVPEIFRPHVDAYIERTVAHALVTTASERVVLNTTAGVVGTLDRVYLCADNTPTLGDVKTSKSLDFSWLSFVIQLALYADADYVLSADGSAWEPMPPLRSEYAILMHCPSNAPENTAAVTFDLAFGRRAADTALAVRSLRSQAPKTVPYQHALPVPSQGLARLAAATAAVKNADSFPELSEIWSSYQDVWSDDLTRLGGEIVAQHSAPAESTR